MFKHKILQNDDDRGQNRSKLDPMPIYGYTYFGHNSAIFCQFQISTYQNDQETELYLISTTSHRLVLFLKRSNFGGQNGPIYAWPLMWHITIWGPKIPLNS